MAPRPLALITAGLILTGTAALCRETLNVYGASRARDQAEALRENGEYDQAWRTLEAALRVTPNAAELWTELGQTYRAAWFFRLKPELLRSALQAYERAESLNPLSAAPPAELARTFALAGADREADRAFLRALRHDPRNPGLLVDRAQTLEKLGQRPAALALYRAAAHIKPNEYSQAAEERLRSRP
ncbi:tetratricopeptide repeat protein (plasmid) [Deinococcus taeanensis]|uniref:tetratricopeptide repeat protein n=1 Tax=Deinococcus taeanensis TaxID=2737050 RepID=UPI001CDB97FB|nr:tetratricopeptide repeat protein [Deinococcus taeanensis]UBV44318.1 tetratricopeptide repeat protein [Deinococcus taeanensis]